VPTLLAQLAEHLPADLAGSLTQLSEALKKGESIDPVRPPPSTQNAGIYAAYSLF
jgi:hypothetical protein